MYRVSLCPRYLFGLNDLIHGKAERLGRFLKQQKLLTGNFYCPGLFACVFVSMGVRGKPRMYCSLAGFLYRPLWTFQLWPPDAPAPTDAFRTLAAEVGTYGRE
jgi:hypothetical protein